MTTASFNTWRTHPAMHPDSIDALISDLLGSDNLGFIGRDVEAAGTLGNLRGIRAHLQMVMREVIDAIDDQDLDGARLMLRLALERTTHMATKE